MAVQELTGGAYLRQRRADGHRFDQDRVGRGQSAGRDAKAKDNLLVAQAEAGIRQAYTKGWQMAQEAAEGAAFAFMFADLTFFSLVAITLFSLRAFGQKMLGWQLTKEGGIRVPMFPPYSMMEAAYRTPKILFLIIIVTIIWGSVISLAYMISHPLQVAQLLGCQYLSAIMPLFGVTCQLTPVAPTP